MASSGAKSSLGRLIPNDLAHLTREVRAQVLHSGVCGAILTVAAFSDWPYSMYVLLRLFVCCSSAYIAFRLYSGRRVLLVWVFGAISLLFNPILPIRMSRADWERTNAITAVIFFACSAFLVWDELFRRGARDSQITAAVLTAGNVCDEFNGHNTRILKLDSSDSSSGDYFVVTSATDRRQARVLADVIKRRLLNDHNLEVFLGDGANSTEWILLDYVDFTIHIFTGEKREFYDVEGARASAISFTIREFQKALGARGKP